MRYCKRCVQPDTRPGIFFNKEGVCGACIYQEEASKKIDWKLRKQQLLNIAKWAKVEAKKRKSNYDCTIGVSGGKDSTFQALYARDVLGLRALLVSTEPEGITEIGLHNRENLKQLGFDSVVIRPNPSAIKPMIKRDFYKYLNPVKITEMALVATPYIIADKFKIPLIVQGENAALTLGTSKTGLGNTGDALNLSKLNTVAGGIQEYIKDGFDEKDLYLYWYDAQAMRKKGHLGVWLQYYLKEWSLDHNFKFAQARGLRIKPKELDLHDIGTYCRYSQLDSEIIQLNQMLKHIKFGFGQCTDHACYDIRIGNITRKKGIELVKEYDGQCADRYIKMFCDYIGITMKEFWRVANSFRGPMWKKTASGKWALKDPIWESKMVK